MAFGSGFLFGPPPRLPGAVDRLAEGWARLPPRVRLLSWAIAITILATQCSAYRDGLTAQWGGEGVTVLQATHSVPAGADPTASVTEVRLPPVAVPPDPTTDLGDNPRLTVPLLEGAVLTQAHLSPVGAAAALAPGDRLLPVPIDPAWGIEQGVVVDAWAVDRAAGPPRQLLTDRPVLAVQGYSGRQVALLSVPADKVAEATSVLSSGQLLLTLRPP